MDINNDIKGMSFCCLKCGDSCFIYKATADNNIEAKQKIAANWAQEYGGMFTTDEVFCYGCKKEGMPQNKMLLRCTVRKCAKEKQLESCSQCRDLEKCDKALWTNWPNVKTEALRIQKSLKL